MFLYINAAQQEFRLTTVMLLNLNPGVNRLMWRLVLYCRLLANYVYYWPRLTTNVNLLNCKIPCENTKFHSFILFFSLAQVELHNAVSIIAVDFALFLLTKSWCDQRRLALFYHYRQVLFWVYGLNQWETTLHCNFVSHLLSPYSERSLNINLHTNNCWAPICDICSV